MFARLATAFSREGGDSKGLGAPNNDNESPGQRDTANVPNVEYTLTEAFPPLQSESDFGCTITNLDQQPPKEKAADDGARIQPASSNPSTPPPSSPILEAQQQQQHQPISADHDKSQQQQLQQNKPAPLPHLHLHLRLQPRPTPPPTLLIRRPAPDAREALCRIGHNPKCMPPESPDPPRFRALRSAKRRPTI
ncbi:hypothetical protein PG988_010008 [Apiospora saccharicola]